MKSKLLRFFCVLMVLCGVQEARAQGIVFDTTDVKAIFEAGSAITRNMDTLTTFADIGAPGQSSWNFGALNTTSVTILRSVAVAATPYAANFPQATHALRDSAFKFSFFYSGLNTVVDLDGTGYAYYTLQGNLLNHGFKGAGNAWLAGSPWPAEGQWLNSPASVDYALPLFVGRTWISSYAETITGSATVVGFVFPFGPLTTTHTITYTVDAYGPLTIPGGWVQDALRIRKSDRFVSDGAPGHRVGYIFLAKNGAAVELSVNDTSATTGLVSVDGVQWSPARSDLPVPIVLARFVVVQSDADQVRLEWTTVSEINNFGFFVQRRGSEETEFTDVPGGFVGGHGTTAIPQSYSYTDIPGRAGSWWYRLRQVDLDGSENYSEPVHVRIVTGVEKDVPASFELAQNYPNPFNPSTTIRYGLPSRSAVRLTVLNTLGQQIAVLVREERDAGIHQVVFDASGLPSGVYIYRLQASDFVETRSMLLLK